MLSSENPRGHEGSIQEAPSGAHASLQSTGKEQKHKISYFLVIWAFQELVEHKILSWEEGAKFEWIQS